jgi:hypothetical protein
VSLDAKTDWIDFVHQAWLNGELLRITLAGPRSSDKSVRQVIIRPVKLQEQMMLSFLYRHETMDVTKNLIPAEGFELIAELIGGKFAHGYLQTPAGVAHLDYPAHRDARIRYEKPPQLPSVVAAAAAAAAAAGAHDRAKQRRVDVNRPWLQAQLADRQQLERGALLRVVFRVRLPCLRFTPQQLPVAQLP